MVKHGETTWDELEKHGKVKPSRRAKYGVSKWLREGLAK